MMKYYVNPEGVYLYATDGDPPEGGIAVEPPPEAGDQVWLFPGWTESKAKFVAIENQWREVQMPIARNNVTAIDFGDGTIPGTIEQWKAYWLALRKWTETNPDFPDSTKRPIAPS